MVDTAQQANSPANHLAQDQVGLQAEMDRLSLLLHAQAPELQPLQEVQQLQANAHQMEMATANVKLKTNALLDQPVLSEKVD